MATPALLMRTSELVDLLDRCLNLRRVRHVECHGRHAFIDIVQCDASAAINSLRTSPESLVDKGPTDASVASGDQDCLLLDIHGLLLSVRRVRLVVVGHEIDLAPRTDTVGVT